jgi:hypothetical protein
MIPIGQLFELSTIEFWPKRAHNTLNYCLVPIGIFNTRWPLRIELPDGGLTSGDAGATIPKYVASFFFAFFSNIGVL